MNTNLFINYDQSDEVKTRTSLMFCFQLKSSKIRSLQIEESIESIEVNTNWFFNHY